MQQDAVQQPDPYVGSVLQGRYKVVRKIGEGGTGAVYEAVHTLIGRHVAVKCVHPDLATNREVIARFQREAQAAASVGNEHIAEVTDMGELDDGTPFIVLELLSGVELAAVLQREGRLTPARAAHIITQACEGLAAAHRQGIIHRDIKPENIFLIQRGSDLNFVKLLDFGISKMRSFGESPQRNLTRSGMAIGTPHYMSPEQAQALPDVDQRTDVYSLGVILYQALAGRLPHDAETIGQVLVQVVTQDAAPLAELAPDIPPELCDIVQRAMMRDPNARYTSTDELAEALAPFAAAYAQEVAELAAPDAETDPPQGRRAPAVTAVHSKHRTRHARWALAVAGCAALAASASVLWVVSSRGSSSTVSPWFGQTGKVSAAAAPIAAVARTTHGTERATSSVPNAPAVPEDVHAAGEITLRISTNPPDAVVAVDGAAVANPREHRLPRSSKSARLSISKDGYYTVAEDVVLDRDRELSFELLRRIPAQDSDDATPQAPSGIADKENVR